MRTASLFAQSVSGNYILPCVRPALQGVRMAGLKSQTRSRVLCHSNPLIFVLLNQYGYFSFDAAASMRTALLAPSAFLDATYL